MIAFGYCVFIVWNVSVFCFVLVRFVLSRVCSFCSVLCCCAVFVLLWCVVIVVICVVVSLL